MEGASLHLVAAVMSEYVHVPLVPDGRLDTQWPHLTQLEDSQSSIGSSFVTDTTPTGLQRSSSFNSDTANCGDFVPPPGCTRFDYSWVVWEDSCLTGWTKLRFSTLR